MISRRASKPHMHCAGASRVARFNACCPPRISATTLASRLDARPFNEPHGLFDQAKLTAKACFASTSGSGGVGSSRSDTATGVSVCLHQPPSEASNFQTEGDLDLWWHCCEASASGVATWRPAPGCRASSLPSISSVSWVKTAATSTTGTCSPPIVRPIVSGSWLAPPPPCATLPLLRGAREREARERVRFFSGRTMAAAKLAFP
mmetsp:Transcript_42864/g.77448  ORF Transcript_42864/g.77448 Transcript_42864/m.77448 type:complete len:205 (-) Transcript_42864:351-965(-)